MGNCTGVFGACVGEDPQAIKKVDKDNMKRALAANQEMNEGGHEVLGGLAGADAIVGNYGVASHK